MRDETCKDMGTFPLLSIPYSKYLPISSNVPDTESSPGTLGWVRHESHPLQVGYRVN